MTATERPSFAPYRLKATSQTIDEVFAQVNAAVYYGYGPDYRAGGRKKVIAGPALDFRTLLEDLVTIEHAQFVPHRDLMAGPCPDDAIRVSFRHDIDSDIVAAVQQAEMQHEFGMSATWLVLHTAPYYGFVDDDGVFNRHDSMIEVYKKFQELGHEVSIHTDPLGLYQFHGIDGAEGFTTELAWMRSHGIEIDGTTAHNFRPTYGAENYEAFTSYLSPKKNGLPLDVDWVDHNGASSPLRMLDDVALGLSYEGNQVLWAKPEPYYGAARWANLWRCTSHDKRRRKDDTLAYPFLEQNRMVDEIRELPLGTDVVLVIHPEYFGARTSHDEAPPLSVDLCERGSVDELDWSTYVPWSKRAIHDAAARRQSISVANDLGMLDRPIEDFSACGLRVLAVGSDQFDAAHLPVAMHASTRLDELLVNDHDAAVIKLAQPNMAIDRLASWVHQGIGLHDPHVVILGVRSDSDIAIGRANWADDTAPGTYRAVTDQGVVSVQHPSKKVDSATGWAAVWQLHNQLVDELGDDGPTVIAVLEPIGDGPHDHAAAELAGWADSRGITVVTAAADSSDPDVRWGPITQSDLAVALRDQVLLGR